MKPIVLAIGKIGIIQALIMDSKLYESILEKTQGGEINQQTLGGTTIHIWDYWVEDRCGHLVHKTIKGKDIVFMFL